MTSTTATVELESVAVRPAKNSPTATDPIGALALVFSIIALIIGILAIVQGQPESEPASAVTPPFDPTARPLPRPLIIDTDANQDDFLAIAYALQSPVFDVRAILVSATGFSTQYAGVENVMRLTQQYGQPDIPVAYGPPEGITKLNADGEGIVPTEWLTSNSYLAQNSWVETPLNSMAVPAFRSAARLLIATLQNASTPIDVLALGPLTNVALAMNDDAALLRERIGTLLFSGGTFRGK